MVQIKRKSSHIYTHVYKGLRTTVPSWNSSLCCQESLMFGNKFTSVNSLGLRSSLILIHQCGNGFLDLTSWFVTLQKYQILFFADYRYRCFELLLPFSWSSVNSERMILEVMRPGMSLCCIDVSSCTFVSLHWFYLQSEEITSERRPWCDFFHIRRAFLLSRKSISCLHLQD